MVLTSIFIAMIIVQSFVPFLGNIPLFILDITILHITVIVGAILLGEKKGALLGMVWGICSLIRAFTMGSPITFLVFTNPLIAIVPRMMVGFLSGWIYSRLEQLWKKRNSSMIVAAVSGSAVNTLLVMSLIYVLVGSQYAQEKGISIEQLPAVLMSIILTNGVAELMAAAIVVPVVASVLQQVRSRGERRG